jgi:hypothetical protein
MFSPTCRCCSSLRLRLALVYDHGPKFIIEQANYFDSLRRFLRLPTRGLAMRRSEPIVDQAGYHIDSEPMGEQRRPGAAAQACGGKYFEPQRCFALR